MSDETTQFPARDRANLNRGPNIYKHSPSHYPTIPDEGSIETSTHYCSTLLNLKLLRQNFGLILTIYFSENL